MYLNCLGLVTRVGITSFMFPKVVATCWSTGAGEPYSHLRTIEYCVVWINVPLGLIQVKVESAYWLDWSRGRPRMVSQHELSLHKLRACVEVSSSCKV